MGMSVGSESGDDDRLNSEINTTPLVDVMLVLLIIFLITIPVVTTSIKVDLPKEVLQVRETKPENIIISVDANSRVFYYDTPVPNQKDLVERLKKVTTTANAKGDPQPEVQIRGDLRANYEGVGRVVLACQRAGIVKIGFITEPPAGN
jgi:biopolymer transport protein ExbD